MRKKQICKTAVFAVMLYSILNTMATADAQSPVLYHEPFESLNFMKEDIIEHAGFKERTIESRKLSITEGRFGKALHLGNPAVPLQFPPGRHTEYSMIGLFNEIRNLFSGGYYTGPNWSGPFFWTAEKINPSSGSVSFWVHGKIKSKRKLFYQSTLPRTVMFFYHPRV